MVTPDKQTVVASGRYGCHVACDASYGEIRPVRGIQGKQAVAQLTERILSHRPQAPIKFNEETVKPADSEAANGLRPGNRRKKN
jgi:hypothetical protein